MVASVIINTTIIVKFLLLMSFCFLSFTSVVSIENSTTKDYQHILSVFCFVLFCDSKSGWLYYYETSSRWGIR